MTEREREARRLRLLLARLERDMESAFAVYERLGFATERARSSGPDPVATAAVALYLQNLYTAIEEFLRRVALELDGSLPAGEEWHRELLGQMTLEVAGVRPRLLGEPLHSDLDLLRRFRHIVRHAYAVEYDWAEMQSAVQAANRVMSNLRGAVSPIEETIRAAIQECERDLGPS